VSYLALWEALQDAVVSEDSGRPIRRVIRTIDPEVIDSDMTTLGRETIERAATLISSGQAVTVLGADHRPVSERTRFIDAVLSLLPGKASPRISAATWWSARSHAPGPIVLAFADWTRPDTARVDWGAIASAEHAVSESRDPAGSASRVGLAGAPILPHGQDTSSLSQPEAHSVPAHRAAAASPPASAASSLPPRHLSRLEERITQADASFQQALGHARREAEERYEEKNTRPEKPLPWWRRWAMRIIGLLRRSEKPSAG